MSTLLAIFFGGGLGCITRYGIGIFSKNFISSNLPFGTFFANIIACAIVGTVFLISKEKGLTETWVQPLILIGFCGGLSTFSTFSNETAMLIHQGQWIWAITNILISISVGIGIVYWLRY